MAPGGFPAGSRHCQLARGVLQVAKCTYETECAQGKMDGNERQWRARGEIEQRMCCTASITHKQPPPDLTFHHNSHGAPFSFLCPAFCQPLLPSLLIGIPLRPCRCEGCRCSATVPRVILFLKESLGVGGTFIDKFAPVRNWSSVFAALIKSRRWKAAHCEKLSDSARTLEG